MPDYLVKIKRDGERMKTERLDDVTFYEAFVHAVCQVDKQDKTLHSVTVELAKEQR